MFRKLFYNIFKSYISKSILSKLDPEIVELLKSSGYNFNDIGVETDFKDEVSYKLYIYHKDVKFEYGLDNYMASFIIVKFKNGEYGFRFYKTIQTFFSIDRVFNGEKLIDENKKYPLDIKIDQLYIVYGQTIKSIQFKDYIFNRFGQEIRQYKLDNLC